MNKKLLMYLAIGAAAYYLLAKPGSMKGLGHGGGGGGGGHWGGGGHGGGWGGGGWGYSGASFGGPWVEPGYNTFLIDDFGDTPYMPTPVVVNLITSDSIPMDDSGIVAED